jgi:hypothetical protein
MNTSSQIEIHFTKLQVAFALCDKHCGSNAVWKVTWNQDHGCKLLCSPHKEELENNPSLLQKWFQFGRS